MLIVGSTVLVNDSQILSNSGSMVLGQSGVMVDREEAQPTAKNGASSS